MSCTEALSNKLLAEYISVRGLRSRGAAGFRMTVISGECRQLITAHQSWDRFTGFLCSDWINVSIAA